MREFGRDTLCRVAGNIFRSVQIQPYLGSMSLLDGVEANDGNPITRDGPLTQIPEDRHMDQEVNTGQSQPPPIN